MDLGNLLGGIDLDKAKEALEALTRNQDALDQLGRLPELFARFADGLDNAGDQAKQAARALVGDGSGADTGIQGALGDVAGSMGDITKALGAGIAKLADTAESVGRVPMMDGPAKRLADAAGDLGVSTDHLEKLGVSLDAIVGLLSKVGAALDGLGEHLGDSGEQARGFMAP